MVNFLGNANDILTTGKIQNWAMDVLRGKPLQEANPLDVLYPKGGTMNLRNYFGKVGTSGFPKNVLLGLFPQGVGQAVKAGAVKYGVPALAGTALGAGLGAGYSRYRNNWTRTPGSEGEWIDYAKQNQLQDWNLRYAKAGGKPYEERARIDLLAQGINDPAQGQLIPQMERLYAQDMVNKKQQPKKQEEQPVVQENFNPYSYVGLPPQDSIEEFILKNAGGYNPNGELVDISQAPGNVYGNAPTGEANNNDILLRGYADNPIDENAILTGGVGNDTVGYDFSGLNNYMTPSELAYQQFLSKSPLLDPNKVADMIKKADKERYKYEVMMNMMAPKNITELPSGAFVLRSNYQAPSRPMSEAEILLKAYDVMGNAYKTQSQMEDKALQRQGAYELGQQLGMSPALLNNEKVLTEIIKGKNAIDKANTVGKQARLTNEAEINAKMVANAQIAKLKNNMDLYMDYYKTGNKIGLEKAKTDLKKDLVQWGMTHPQADKIIQLMGTMGSMNVDTMPTLQLINTLYPGTLQGLDTSNTFNNQMIMNNQNNNDYAGL